MQHGGTLERSADEVVVCELDPGCQVLEPCRVVSQDAPTQGVDARLACFLLLCG
jgi:hypothetical protein